ncbi:glycosyltransferase [Psychrobacter sp. AOP22-C1-C5]|uniref:glycosyltransferase n=1 Tax=Psychrobacter sp. AOP22-C1-C5 TaxID=3457716 RepID=UPI004035A65E
MKFSVLMSVYKNDVPRFFEQALQSVNSNTIKPTEVVLVCDGLLTDELEQVIVRYKTKLALNLIRLDSNMGLGIALQLGIRYCQYEWIARFDADDICDLIRFEKQINFIENNPNIDVLGGQIVEFNQDPYEQKMKRKRVPIINDDIYSYAKSRNPMNHMTVMFRKSAVIAAGNYQNAPYYEDYDLWVRMLLKGCKLANMDEVLVYARAGERMYDRRGGLNYLKQEIRMQINFFDIGFISLFQLSKNLTLRIPVRLLPNKVRGIVYSKLLRDQ